MLLFELFESTLDPVTPQDTAAPDPYDEIAAHALPQYRFTYGRPEHIEALRQRHTELYRTMRRSYLQGTMTDEERREMYHLEDALKRYREAKPLHRIGSDHEFSEFTHDPSGKGYPAKMNSGRDTGFASGMYAFQTPREGTVEVSPPRNPLVIDDLPEHEARHSSVPGVFQTFARSLMRMAKEYADYTPEPMPQWEVDFARNYNKPGVDLDRGIRIKPDLWKLTGYGGMEFKRIIKFFEHYHEPSWRVADDLTDAITTWEKHRQVHPLNILLSRWGHDGVVWGDSDKAQEGNSGTYGAVKFPPIDAEGKLIGLDPVNSKYMRLRGRDGFVA
jgi:hypothetical protein